MDWRQEAIDKLTGYEARKYAVGTLPPGCERTEAQLWVEIVDGGLAVLDDEERLVLYMCFIHKVKAPTYELSERLHIEPRAVYKRRDKALRRFTLALYGALESV